MKTGIVVIGLAIMAVGMFFIAVPNIQIGTRLENIMGFYYEVPLMLKTEIKNGIGFVLLIIGLLAAIVGASHKPERYMPPE